jgi:hypothetical protein
MRDRFGPLLALVCCVAVLGLAACGSSSSSSSSAAASSTVTATASSAPKSSLATAKFALHAGLAFGAFKHWVYNPIKAGALKNPGSHKLALSKAALAAVFTYHELKLAAENAKSSKLLAPLVAPMTAAADKLNSLKGGIKSGSVNSSDIESVNSQLGSISSSASSSGTPIKEMQPSLSQLASGGTS